MYIRIFSFEIFLNILHNAKDYKKNFVNRYCKSPEINFTIRW